jgi:hypothetical protein
VHWKNRYIPVPPITSKHTRMLAYITSSIQSFLLAIRISAKPIEALIVMRVKHQGS